MYWYDGEKFDADTGDHDYLKVTSEVFHEFQAASLVEHAASVWPKTISSRAAFLKK